ESFYLLPARIMFFGQTSSDKDLGWFDKFQLTFENVLLILLRNKWKSILFANLILVAALLFAIFKLDFVLFDPEGEDSFVIKYQAPPGTPIEEVHEAAKDIENRLLKFPKNEI